MQLLQVWGTHPPCTPFQGLCTDISFPHTWAWHWMPFPPLAAVTSRMLTWRNAGMANWFYSCKKKKERKGHFPANFPWRSKLRAVPWWRHWQHQPTLHHSKGSRTICTDTNSSCANCNVLGHMLLQPLWLRNSVSTGLGVPQAIEKQHCHR